MITGNDKFDLFANFKAIAESKKWSITKMKEINYGLQFSLSINEHVGIVRIFEGKKGVRIDLSQIKNEELLLQIEKSLSLINNKDSSKTKSKNTAKKVTNDIYPDELIGVDESGKGDFFGPLVIAGVFVNKNNGELLKELGIMDSKKLSDSQILELSKIIKRICPYSVVSISNKKYNELYIKIKNLNRLLAWGHARTIENLVEKTDCKVALSDQFGDKSLIEKALLEKGKEITLFQRTKAEEITAVAAASIIAREEYIKRLEKLSEKYKITLPKGASTKTIQVAKKIVTQYGKDELEEVAKLHFKTMEQL